MKNNCVAFRQKSLMLQDKVSCSSPCVGDCSGAHALTPNHTTITYVFAVCQNQIRTEQDSPVP